MSGPETSCPQQIQRGGDSVTRHPLGNKTDTPKVHKATYLDAMFLGQVELKFNKTKWNRVPDFLSSFFFFFFRVSFIYPVG